SRSVVVQPWSMGLILRSPAQSRLDNIAVGISPAVSGGCQGHSRAPSPRPACRRSPAPVFASSRVPTRPPTIPIDQNTLGGRNRDWGGDIPSRVERKMRTQMSEADRKIHHKWLLGVGLFYLALTGLVVLGVAWDVTTRNPVVQAGNTTLTAQ